MTKIEMYKTPQCGRCPSVIDLLEDIEAERKDVELEIIDAAEDRMRALSNDVFSVPTVIIDDETKLTGVPERQDILAAIED